MNKDLIVKLRKMGSFVNILYIEDDKEVSEQFENLFRKVFKNIDVVSNGDEGLKKYLSQEYDIVITDIEMPHMDGITLIKEIRKINSEQLIVVTSAYNNSKYLQALIEHGVDKFILKPFDMNKLFRDIARIVSIMYNKKRSEHLQQQLQEKVKLNQLLLDNMITPIVVINADKIHYKNEKFDELFQLNCDIESEECSLSRIFKNEKISQLKNGEFLEYIQLHSSEEYIYLKSANLERFRVVVSPLEGTLNTLVSFVNTEVINREIDRLKCEAKVDALTQLSTREIFTEELETLLENEENYCVICFGLKNIKELIRNFGVGHLHDIYKVLGKNLRIYFEDEISRNSLSLYYFDTNHFVALVHSPERKKIKIMLKEFGNKYRYTTKMAKTYEPMYLDILGMELRSELSVEKNVSEVENQLYMLNGEA